MKKLERKRCLYCGTEVVGWGVKDLEANYHAHIKQVHGLNPEDRPKETTLVKKEEVPKQTKPVDENKKDILDINDDGVVDKKDASLAGKVLRGSRKKKDKKKER